MKLEDIENAINSRTWNDFNTKQPQALPIQNGDIWRAHLKKSVQRHTNKSNKFRSMYYKRKTPNIRETKTTKELTTQAIFLQPRKACGPDGIKNEMLKCSTPEMQGAVLKFFNIILKSGCFPDIWCKGVISPIHKSGDKSDPSNYRGMCQQLSW